MIYKNFPMVSKVIFGRGSINQIEEIINEKRLNERAPFVYIIDDVFENNSPFLSTLTLSYDDYILFVSADEEPKTTQVDAIVDSIILKTKALPSGIIGIGGGTIMDIAKAVSIMLTNPGSSEEYQGWDLVKNPGLYSVGIPTISGTGAEVSRTAVLCGPRLKLGLNSDFTPFDQVILDPELTQTVEKNQWFYTGMDCFIHCVESLRGHYLNSFSQSYGEMAYKLCKSVFLDNLSASEQQDKLMMASWHGGMSIAYSQVGVAHALSYGLSFVLGIKHGIGNCIVFNQLDEFYPEDVKIFRAMLAKHQVPIPNSVCKNISSDQLEKMIDIALTLEPLWENAVGSNWKQIITREKIRSLYIKM